MTDSMRSIVRGGRGESFADVARRLGSVAGVAVLPTATDQQVLDAISAQAAALVQSGTIASVNDALSALGIPVAAAKVTPAAGSVTPQITRNFSPVNGTAYTLVARFQRAGIRHVLIQNTAGAANAGVAASFDCRTDTLTTSIGTGEWSDIGGDWIEVRVTSAVVSAGGTPAPFNIRVSQSGAYPFTSNGTDFKIVGLFELRAAGTATNVFPSNDLADASFAKLNVTATSQKSDPAPLSAKTIGAASLAETVNARLNGSASAARVIEANGTTNSRLYRPFTTVDTAVYQFIVTAKAGTRKWLRLLSNGGALWSFYVNLETGEAIRDANISYDGATIAVTYDVNGYFRIVVQATASAAAGSNANIIVLDDSFAWPNRTGDGASGFAIKSAELRQNGATLWLTDTFAAGDWTLDGVTVTDDAEVYGGVVYDIHPQTGLVGREGLSVSVLPRENLHGTGTVRLNGYRHFIPRPDLPDLSKAFRAAMAWEIAKGVPIVWMGDSITFDTSEVARKNNYLDMICSFVNQGSPADEPLLHGVADYLLSASGITIAGPRSNGLTGPLGESLIMQPGCVLTFVGTYEQLGLFYDRAAGSGTLTVARDGGTIATISTAGAAELDRYSGAIATGTTAAATYTITCSAANVMVTGIDRLGVKAAGSLPRVRFVRWAHGSYSFANFNTTNVTSMLKQVSAFSPTIKPTVVIAVGINERQIVGTGGYATMQTRMQASLDALTAGGVTRMFGQMPLRTSAAADAAFYASALPYDQLIGGMQEKYWENDIPILGTHSLDLALAGKMDPDGIHPAESGLVDVAYMAITGICRHRGAL